MKKYFIFYLYHFRIQYFKKMSEAPLDSQELQYPSDFSTASSSSVTHYNLLKIYKKKYQP